MVSFQPHGFVRPASPRAAFIKKLQHIKENKSSYSNPQKLSLIRHSNSQTAPPHTQTGAKHGTNNAQTKAGRKVMEMNNEKDTESDEEEEKDDSEDSDNNGLSSTAKFAKASSQMTGKLNKQSLQNGGFDFRITDGTTHENNLFQSSSVHLLGVPDKEKSRNDSVCSTDKKLVRVLSYTAMTETQTSESEQDVESGTESDDSNSDEDYVLNQSQSKIVTRKIAPKHMFPMHGGTADYLTASLNTSAFIPSAKSPIVISKERVGPIDAIKDDARYSYHSDSDSIGNRRNNSFSDDEEVEKSEKSGKSTVREKKTLQFDDDSEWADLTPKPMKSRKHQSETVDGEHDKTLVEEPGKLICMGLKSLFDKNVKAGQCRSMSNRVKTIYAY